MIRIILELIKPILGASQEIARKRLLNHHTSKGILMLLGAGYLFEIIDEHKLNTMISFLAGTSIDYADVYLFLFNCTIIYMVYKGVTMILKLAEKWIDQTPFDKDNKNNNQ